MLKGFFFLFSQLLLSCFCKFSSAQMVRDSFSYTAAVLSESQIAIPVQINLKAFYSLAEKAVDPVFTSPNYPKDWVQADCATRYKYHFRRSPLKISAAGTSFQLSFTGFYKIIGSTRACVGGKVLSPWIPECACGFEEGERKVEIGFLGSFVLLPNHTLQLNLSRTEPKPKDKCEVCFWGQDITATVMEGLKEELDVALKAVADSFGTIPLRPYVQQAWQQLAQVYPLPQLGYLSLQPKQLRMDNIGAKADLLNITLGISATPVISFIKPQSGTPVVPNLSTGGKTDGFNIHIEAALEWDSLSKVANSYLGGKRFELSEGLIKQHIVVNECKLYSDGGDNLMVAVAFTGSHKGTIYFRGKPYYNSNTKRIEIENFDYDLKTNSFLLRTANWLFDNKIVSEIKKYTSIDLSTYYLTAATTMDSWLNREWTKGISGSGKVTDIKLTGVHALPQHLLIRSNCTGQLAVTVTEMDLNF